MIPLVATEDANGRVLDGVRQPSYMDYIKLTADSAVTLAVPSSANHVMFHGTADIFVKYTDSGLTSASYSATSTGGGAFEIIPKREKMLRTLKNVSGLSFVSKSACDLTLSFFG